MDTMNRRTLLTRAGLLLSGAGARGVPAAPGLTAAVEDGALVARAGREPVFAYRMEPLPGPAGTPPFFARNAYLHPFHAPNGAVVTDDFPADHPHQRGVFCAWTKTELGELHPDFWNLGSGTGRIRHVRLEGRPEAGRKGLRFRAVHLWEARGGDAWIPALEETWDATLLPPAFADRAAPGAAYVLDLVIRQKPVSDLRLVQHRYGGMAVRSARAWLARDSGVRLLTSEGKDRAGADTTAARWVAWSGPVEGREAGVVLMEHPSVPGSPNPLRVHPDVPYANFALPQAGPRTLPGGRETVFRYRVAAFNGPADAGRLEALWREYAAG